MKEHTELYLEASRQAIAQLDHVSINSIVDTLAEVRDQGGRVFFLGVGGSAANASHAVNDFRKIAGIECYAVSDNVAELTARTNDDGWHSCYANWLLVSRLSARDAVFVLSVGGGSLAQDLSVNIVRSVELAVNVRARVLGIVGRDGGFTATMADACVIVPTIREDLVTPITEALHGVVLHLIVSHPALKRNDTKWESACALV